MRLRILLRRFSTIAPGLAGAVCCVAIAFGTVSCDKKGGTPDWDTPGSGGSPAATSAATSEAESAKPATPATQQPAKPASVAAPAATGSSPEGLRFIAYNVENWLTMDRYVDNKPLKDSPKPDSEKKAVIEILAKNTPDVVGVCEIGSAADFAEIQESLKAAGIDLPHSHYSGGSDSTRHLGILSRFPITATAKPVEMEYQLKGQTFGFNRGVLDATIQARGKTYRFLGVHLKSKRDVEEGDQEEMRVNEARLLRRHLDTILQADADARVIVYGDFNDTRPTKAFKTVTGSYNDPGYLTAIPFKDSRGHAWTHHWAPHDIYSRIDFVTVTRALRPEVDFQASHVIDDPDWDKASDHRPVLAIFK
jgi:endonuclease/exonuclease/phosphatase family metal-dependent hydrolase